MGATKLTLRLEDNIIADAKAYASSAGTSLSKLVESYLAALVAGPQPDEDPPVLQRLRGTMKGVDIEDYRRHLVDKYEL